MKKPTDENYTAVEIEKRDIYPKGKRIARLTTYDSRFETYWAGIHAPDIDTPPADRPRLLWYDIARDVVCIYDYETKKWKIPPKGSEVLPKFAFEITEDGHMRHCGIVLDDDEAPKNIKNFLDEEFKL